MQCKLNQINPICDIVYEKSIYYKICVCLVWVCVRFITVAFRVIPNILLWMLTLQLLCVQAELHLRYFYSKQRRHSSIIKLPGHNFHTVHRISYSTCNGLHWQWALVHPYTRSSRAHFAHNTRRRLLCVVVIVFLLSFHLINGRVNIGIYIAFCDMIYGFAIANAREHFFLSLSSLFIHNFSVRIDAVPWTKHQQKQIGSSNSSSIKR